MKNNHLGPTLMGHDSLGKPNLQFDCSLLSFSLYPMMMKPRNLLKFTAISLSCMHMATITNTSTARHKH